MALTTKQPARRAAVRSNRLICCRHLRTWIIAGGAEEWCYECGAIRMLRQTGQNSCVPWSAWCKPTGQGGENPWSAWEKQNAIYRKRRQHIV